MDFKSQLAALKTKSVTVYTIGGNQEYAGTLLDVANDFISVDTGPDNAPHQVRSLIPIAAIACVVTRS